MLHVSQPYNDPRFNPEIDRKTGFVTRNLLTAPMLDLAGRPVGVIQAINKSGGDFDAVDEAMIQLLAAQAGVAIQRYNLQQAAIEATALRREMELAKAVQQALIPKTPPRIDGIECIGYSKTASATGGDCYDLWETADGKLGIFLGDATGHGIAPAMVVSQTRTLVRAMCDARGSDPRDLLTCVNARLAQDLDAGHFVTAFVGFVSPGGKLDWCAAGHGPILIRTAHDQPVHTLDANAPPLGVVPSLPADDVEPVELCAGGLLCVPSDGITDAFKPGTGVSEDFGSGRVVKILNESTSLSLQQVIEQLKSAVRAWEGTDDPRDDQTLVIARRISG